LVVKGFVQKMMRRRRRRRRRRIGYQGETK
jgi:hypothetical protein